MCKTRNEFALAPALVYDGPLSLPLFFLKPCTESWNLANFSITVISWLHPDSEAWQQHDSSMTKAWQHHDITCPLYHIQVGEGVASQLPGLPHGPVWGDSSGRLHHDVDGYGGDKDDCNIIEILFNHPKLNTRVSVLLRPDLAMLVLPPWNLKHADNFSEFSSVFTRIGLNWRALVHLHMCNIEKQRFFCLFISF